MKYSLSIDFEGRNLQTKGREWTPFLDAFYKAS
jgi:hypothetical protein